jgi:hypothetical protein
LIKLEVVADAEFTYYFRIFGIIARALSYGEPDLVWEYYVTPVCPRQAGEISRVNMP